MSGNNSFGQRAKENLNKDREQESEKKSEVWITNVAKAFIIFVAYLSHFSVRSTIRIYCTILLSKYFLFFSTLSTNILLIVQVLSHPQPHIQRRQVGKRMNCIFKCFELQRNKTRAFLHSYFEAREQRILCCHFSYSTLKWSNAHMIKVWHSVVVFKSSSSCVCVCLCVLSSVSGEK